MKLFIRIKQEISYLQKYCVILIYIISFSCQETHKPTIKGEFETLKIDVENKSDFFLSDFVNEVSYIPLETGPESIISRIDKLYVYNNEFYILDKRQSKILVFSLDGKFIRKLDFKGKGPGEYIEISDFSIDINKHENKEFLPIDKNLGDFQTNTGGQFMLNSLNELLFKESLSYKIYKFDSNGFKNYFELDFGDFMMPSDYFDNEEMNFNELVFNLNDGTYAVYPKIFLENSNFIFFRYQYKEYRYALYNKKSKLLKHGNIMDDLNHLSFIYPIYLDSNTYYSAIEPTHILNYFKYLQENTKSDSTWKNLQSIEANQILFNIEPSSNPIIIKYSYDET